MVPRILVQCSLLPWHQVRIEFQKNYTWRFQEPFAISSSTLQYIPSSYRLLALPPDIEVPESLHFLLAIMQWNWLSLGNRVSLVHLIGLGHSNGSLQLAGIGGFYEVIDFFGKLVTNSHKEINGSMSGIISIVLEEMYSLPVLGLYIVIVPIWHWHCHIKFCLSWYGDFHLHMFKSVYCKFLLSYSSKMRSTDVHRYSLEVSARLEANTEIWFFFDQKYCHTSLVNELSIV